MWLERLNYILRIWCRINIFEWLELFGTLKWFGMVIIDVVGFIGTEPINLTQG